MENTELLIAYYLGKNYSDIFDEYDPEPFAQVVSNINHDFEEHSAMYSHIGEFIETRKSENSEWLKEYI